MTEAGKGLQPGELPLSQSPPGVSPASPPSPAPTLITIDDFKKLQLRVGTIVSAQDHPNADRLLVLTVDLGDGTQHQVVAGIRGSYEAASLLGKLVVVVANLKPATLRGVESQGMVLAASDGDRLVLVAPEQQIRPGSQVR